MDNTEQANSIELLSLKSGLDSSAKWFYWIAGFSILNTSILFFGGNVSFIVGLGITQMIDGLVYDSSSSTKIIAFLIELGIAGLLAGVGFYATKGEKWAFTIGMFLYFLDGLLFLIVEDWLSLGFHIFVLFSIYKGYKGLEQIKEIEARIDGGVGQIESEITKNT
jgi:hypothetical protein